MNHASEWMKFFDEHTGRYHYKHKGSGVVRDMLIAIGKSFAKTTTVKKAAAQAVEKGKKIQQLLWARRSQKWGSPSLDAMLKLSQILANRL